MPSLRKVACVFPFTWNHLKDSLRKVKIHHAIWLQEMQMLQNKLFFFFHPWVSQNYSWGQPTKHAKIKEERKKEAACVRGKPKLVLLQSTIYRSSPDKCHHKWHGMREPLANKQSLSWVWHSGLDVGRKSYLLFKSNLTLQNQWEN